MKGDIHTVSIIGCGWLGLPLGKILKEEGFDVKGSTTHQEKFAMLKHLGITPYYLRLTPEPEGELSDLFFSDLLIINFPPERNDNVAELYPQQVESCLEQAIRHDVKFILFISSTSVYPSMNAIVRENDARKPEKNTGKALLEAEAILQHALSVKTTIIRFGGLIGEDRNPAVSLAKKDHLENADAPVNVIHLDDCLAIIDQIINQHKWGYVFNACAPLHPKRSELYIHAAKKQNIPLPKFMNGSANGYKIVDSTLLVNELGYEFRYPDPMKMF